MLSLEPSELFVVVFADVSEVTAVVVDVVVTADVVTVVVVVLVFVVVRLEVVAEVVSVPSPFHVIRFGLYVFLIRY